MSIASASSRLTFGHLDGRALDELQVAGGQRTLKPAAGQALRDHEQIASRRGKWAFSTATGWPPPQWAGGRRPSLAASGAGPRRFPAGHAENQTPPGAYLSGAPIRKLATAPSPASAYRRLTGPLPEIVGGRSGPGAPLARQAFDGTWGSSAPASRLDPGPFWALPTGRRIKHRAESTYAYYGAPARLRTCSHVGPSPRPV